MNKREVKGLEKHQFGNDFHVFLVENDPQTFEEAMTSINAPMWIEAINDEIYSIMSNHTW